MYQFGQNPLKDVDSRVFTRMICGKNLTRWPWPMTLKINRVPDSLKDKICTKFGQNPLKDVDPRVFTRMLRKDRRTEGRQEGRMDGSITISLRNFVGEGIIKKTLLNRTRVFIVSFVVCSKCLLLYACCCSSWCLFCFSFTWRENTNTYRLGLIKDFF